MNDHHIALALEVDLMGKVIRVIHDGIGLNITKDKLFPTIFTSSEFGISLNFLQRLRTDSKVFEVPLGLLVNEKPKSLYFTGVNKSDHFLIIAVDKQGLDSSVYDEIAKVNNELANLLREAMKEKHQQKESSPDFDEFTKLNNELINTQRELSKTNKKLEEINNQKNQLIGVAAHDLRNPLGVISGFVRFVVGTSDNLRDDQKQMLQKAIDTSDKMLVMLEELLDISEIDSGKVTLKLAKVSLNQLLIENIELNQVIANRKNIIIEFHSTDDVTLTIDPLKIEQVFSNLISNAIKYSHQNTKISVVIEKCAHEMSISVTDQGQGIPKNEVAKVFIPFGTTSVKSTGGEKSTGLGLAITQKIIEAHGGSIKLTSEVGVGSTFCFKLPLNDK